MNLGRIFQVRRFVSLLLATAISISFFSCATVRTVDSSKKSNKVVFKSLSVDAFAKILERDDLFLVDVRTAEEYAAGHLPDVDRNLNVGSKSFFKDYQSLPKDKLIALYCKGGGRSKQVAGVLAGNGYRVVELAVGYDGWVKAGGKTEK